MTTYRIYSADMPNHGCEIMAIAEDECREPDFKPSNYFLTTATNIIQSGIIEVDGDDHLLASYFSVK